MVPGTYVAKLRFLRDDGQRDERRLAFKLQPVTLSSYYSFNTALQDNRFPDDSIEKQPDAWHDNTSLWLFAVTKGPHWNPTVKLGDRMPGFAPEPQGKFGGALRLDKPAKPFSRSLPGLTRWRGSSASLWFKIDALPEAKKSTTILTSPFALTLDDKGTLSFAQGGKPASLDVIKPGEWHFIELRSDMNSGKVIASLDGKTEVNRHRAAPARQHAHTRLLRWRGG